MYLYVLYHFGSCASGQGYGLRQDSDFARVLRSKAKTSLGHKERNTDSSLHLRETAAGLSPYIFSWVQTAAFALAKGHSHAAGRASASGRSVVGGGSAVDERGDDAALSGVGVGACNCATGTGGAAGGNRLNCTRTFSSTAFVGAGIRTQPPSTATTTAKCSSTVIAAATQCARHSRSADPR